MEKQNQTKSDEQLELERHLAEVARLRVQDVADDLLSQYERDIDADALDRLGAAVREDEAA